MKKKIDNFDLRQIAESGQCFRWKRISHNAEEQTYLIPAFGRALYVTQKGNEFDFSCTEEEWGEVWAPYFDMDRDYAGLGEKILASDDEHLKECYRLGSGIRILKQELWEIIFSFMVSQNNNISRISATIEKVCEACGKAALGYSDDREAFCGNSASLKSGEGVLDKVYRFPSWEEIPDVIFDEKSFGFGYRNEYLRGLCLELSERPEWLGELKAMSYEAAMKSLLAKKGIGIKVANCISLFGLGHIDAFPVDTHIKQLLDRYYPNGLDLSGYEGEAGIIQQYLFYYELKHK